MTAPDPLAFPTDADGWAAFATERPAAAIAVVADVDARLVAAEGGRLDAAARLDLWNDADLALGQATNEVYLLSEAHPDAAVRAAAEEQVQRLEALSAARLLDRGLFAALEASTPRSTRRRSMPISGACSRTSCATSAAAASTCPTTRASAYGRSPTATPS